MEEKNLYDILEITEEERKLQGKDFQDVCKRNFKRLSKKWHPDKWVNATSDEKKKAEDMFKEISHANTVLSDESERKKYDFQQAGGNSWPNFDDDFGFGGFPGFGMGGFRNVPRRGDNIGASIEITLSESYFGCTKEILVNKPKSCSHCNGTGSSDGKEHKCPHCNGTGRMRKTETKGYTTIVTETTCQYCNGTGREKTSPCHYCGGSGVEYETVKETIEIPRGMFEGTLTFGGRGATSDEGGPNGDLLVQIKIKKDDKLERIGNDIVYKEIQPFNKIMLGYEGEVENIDGEVIKFTVPELTHDKTKITIMGKGMPIIDQFGRNMGFGNFVIRIDYRYPEKLTKEQRNILKNF